MKKGRRESRERVILPASYHCGQLELTSTRGSGKPCRTFLSPGVGELGYLSTTAHQSLAAAAPEGVGFLAPARESPVAESQGLGWEAMLECPEMGNAEGSLLQYVSRFSMFFFNLFFSLTIQPTGGKVIQRIFI